MLFVISAPSGAGKTTIIRELFKRFPDLKFSVSATTRSKRANEIEGKDYYFISPDDFKQKIGKNEFAEWEEVFGNYYGTLRTELNKGQSVNFDMILDVDVKGALSIKKIYPDAIIIFIDVPIDELMNRLLKRGTETEEQVKKREERISMEIAQKNQFDYVIDNSDNPDGIKKAVKKIITIINKYKNK